jgi:hypothetical protein
MAAEHELGTAPDELRDAAVLVAVRAGLLKKCPVHGDVYDPGRHDYQGAIMIATFLVNQSDPLVAPFGGDRAALVEMLKSICRSHESRCTRCAPPQAE